MYAQAEWDAQVKALPAGASKGRTLSWRGLFNEIASGVAGFLDGLTGGLTSYLWKGLNWLGRKAGLGSLVQFNSQAYQIGNAIGTVASIALMFIPGGQVVALLGKIHKLAAIAHGVDALLKGNYVGALTSLGSVLVGSGAACGLLKNGSTIARIGGYAIKGLGVGLAAYHGYSGVQQILHGDILEGVLSLGQAASDLAGASKSCFVAGTPVLTPNGCKSIEQFVPGDMVISRPEFDPDEPLTIRRVQQLFVRVSPVLNLHVGGRIIGTTGEHPFWVVDKGWVEARDIRIGDVLVSHDGQALSVEGIADSGRIDTVYNIEVEEDHTYFVGALDWGWSLWAHNYRAGSIRDKISKLTVGGSLSRLMAGLLTKWGNVTKGAYYQARRVLAYGAQVVAVEFKLHGGKLGDILLQGGKAIETKAWRAWNTLSKSVRRDRLRELRKQVKAYLQTPAVTELVLEFKHAIPKAVENLLKRMEKPAPNPYHGK